MWYMWAVLLLATCAGAQLGVDQEGVVQIAQGEVLGHLDPSGKFYTFYNIPYATAPTGTHRYKAPLPPPVWMHRFDAVDRGITCIQSIPSANRREDCLVVNVFVPNTNATNLPVAVIIHGGGYHVGFGNIETFNNLVQEKNIITVTFNYRLGFHGFLCLGTEDVPGNAGLKDQLALLRWVKQNIASFGGNPEDVTLLGCSAGAGSIDVLTLSRATDGLFNKAIVESGASFGTVGVQSDPLSNAKYFAKLLNFDDVDNITSLEAFYKTASFQQLNIYFDDSTNSENSAVLFGPCVERDFGQEMILEDAPINIIKQGKYKKIPLLYGFSNMEGLIRISLFDAWRVQMNEKFSDFLPPELAFDSEEEKEEVAKTVREYYFGEGYIGVENIVQYINLFTDVMFGYPMLKALTHRVESLNDTIYLYEYSFVDEYTPSIPHTNERGADHCDQSIAVFDEDNTNITEEYRQMKGIMRELWGNFILNGSPVAEDSQLPQWPPASAARSPHMSLGQVLELKGVLLKERGAFWDSIYEKHYRPPVLPRHPGDPAPGSATSISNKNLFFLFIIYCNLIHYVCSGNLF